MNRRFFLKSGGIALASVGMMQTAPSFLQRTAFGQTIVAGGRRKTLIAIFQRGAVDGLNVVVPHGEKAYYDLRPSIAVPRPKSGNADCAIDLDGYFGLHPALAPFKPIWDAQHLAIIDAVGSPDNTRSHFDAQDYMESATPGVKSTTDGWLNRYLQTKPDGKATPFRAVSMTQNLPRSMQGKAGAIAMSNLADFTIRAGASSQAIQGGFEAMFDQASNDVFKGTGKETFEAVNFLKEVNPAQYKPVTDVGGWDTHVNQGNSRGQLALRLTDFGTGIAALYTDLGPARMDDVVILTMSEFGRTAKENGNRGTDHGHANAMFVIGNGVRGGKVYGQWPGLKNDQLNEGRDLALTTDFRDVFGEVVQRHLGDKDLKRVFPGYAASPSKFKGFLA